MKAQVPKRQQAVITITSDGCAEVRVELAFGRGARRKNSLAHRVAVGMVQDYARREAINDGIVCLAITAP